MAYSWYAAEDKRFVQLLDLQFSDFDKFRSEYSPGAGDHLQASGAAGGVVSTAQVTAVKGMWRPKYVVMNFWASSDEYRAAYDSGLFAFLSPFKKLFVEYCVNTFYLKLQ